MKKRTAKQKQQADLDAKEKKKMLSTTIPEQTKDA
jgi:hypothetical protein